MLEGMLRNELLCGKEYVVETLLLVKMQKRASSATEEGK